MHNNPNGIGPNGISETHTDPAENTAPDQTIFRAGGGDGRLSPLVMHERGEGSGESEDGNVSVFDDTDDSRLTAIYRPESSESWKEQLRLAGEKEKIRMSRKEQEREPSKPGPHMTLDNHPIKPDDELAGLTLHDHHDPAHPGAGTNNLASSATASAPNPAGGPAPDGKNSSTAGSVVQKGFDSYKVWKPKRTLRS
jgi:striatin 1/3/4